jgi:two-component system sensor histidine kinase RegB
VDPSLPAAAPPAPEADTSLRDLRWVSVAVQALIVLVARPDRDGAVRALACVGLVALTAASAAWLRRPARGRLGAVRLPALLALDVVTLTLLLALTGGAANPFAAVYTINVALGALLLDPPLAVAHGLLTVVAYGLLFTLPADPHAHHAVAGHGHLVGMWAAHAVVAAGIALFVGRAAAALRERARALAVADAAARQAERLATLSAFSANAAHELGSPLGTIAVAAGELRAALAVDSAAPPSRASLLADAALVEAEALRCRDILGELAARAGAAMGEEPAPVPLTGLGSALAAILGPRAARVEVEDGAGPPLRVGPRGLLGALGNLVRNALDASPPGAPVTLRVVSSDVAVAFVVEDRGPGLPPAVQARLGEPFVTGRAAEGGLGLGLYLVFAFARRHGGSLVFAAAPGGGTRATLTLPRPRP